MMTLVMLKDLFFWCLILNIGILVWWFLFFAFAHDWVYRVHGRWFKISVEGFDAIHYAGMAFFKICIFLFNLAPYLALCIIE